VEAGGTLIIFPSVPKGEIFNELLSPLGEARQVVGNTQLTFANGTRTMALNAHTVLRLPERSGIETRVFAKDSRGGIVGVRYAHGKGQVIFFGADFSLWCVPPGGGRRFEEGAMVARRDYPEEIQSAARLALPALMKEVGVDRKVYAAAVPGKARDVGLYVTELIADAGSRPFEKRDSDTPGFGFVGVTNFSIDQARKADIYLTDPLLTDLAAKGQERYLHLPPFFLPPRQSVLLPIHVPLNSSFWEMAPGIEAGDDVAYATAELSKVSYDGLTLRLEFTAPADAEVGLHLEGRPQEAKVDEVAAAIQEDPRRHVYLLRIPKGEAPDFVRTVELAYPRCGPRITIMPQEPWIAGDARVVHLRIENPGPSPLEGALDFTAGRIYKSGNPPLSVRVPSRSSREFNFPVEIPADTPENQAVQLKATFRPKDSTALWVWDAHVRVHQPFDWNIGPVADFPLREDQSFPILHPVLVNLNLPGEAAIHVRVKNWLNLQQVVLVASEGSDLNFMPSSSYLVLPPNGDAAAEIRVVPTKGAGAYRFGIVLQSGNYKIKEDGVLAAMKGGEALAYALDYDRDGFEDVILENSQVRLFVTPHAGGRAFGFVLKDSNSNAFDSVGGMRDSFTTRFEPEDMKGLPEWTRANWLGLYNRPYSFRVVNAAGAEAEVRLEYTAPDIYPKGVKLERSLKLSGKQNVVIEETRLTPFGIDKPQAYVLETSVPFKVFNEPNYNDWFVQGRGAEEFVPSKVVALPPSVSYIGTRNKKGGQTFALISLTAPAHTELIAEQHSALIRCVYPSFSKENEPHTYRAAYYLGEGGAAKEIETIAADLKAEKK
jgi:predicted NUDIX family NTP pyrophosphohydrolase